MKKITTLFLACAFSLAASAQGLAIRPKPAVAQKSAMPQTEQKVAPQPNTNDGRGVDMYAGLMLSYSNVKSMVKFNSNSPTWLTALAPFSPGADSRDLDVIRSGVLYDGTYYGMLSTMYTYEELPKAFVTVDLTTGEYTVMRDMKQQSYAYWYEMTYDYAHNKCYAIGLDPDGAMAVSTLYEVDLKQGTFTKVRDLDAYYLTLSCDYWGTLWGIRYKVGEGNTNAGSILSSIDVATGKTLTDVELTKDGQSFIASYAQTMEFDYTTGQLWWLGMKDEGLYSRQRLYSVDTKTGVMSDYGGFGYGDQGVAMCIPFQTADSATAPARVDNLTATAADLGDTKATLAWTNPATSWNGEALTDLKSILVSRDGKELATVDVTGKIGEDFSWVDENAAAGTHEYVLTPTNSKGEKGITDNISCFVGRDKPGSVGNVSINASSDAQTITLMWSRPATGANNGWYDETSVTYTITRNPDGKVVAEGIKELMLVDSELGEESMYSYTIVASDPQVGDGPAITSQAVKAGHPFEIPFVCVFDNQANADRWTVINANNDTGYFKYLGGNIEMTKAMGLEQTVYDNSDDWIISPPISLEKGKQYKVTTTVSQFQVEKYQNFELTVGKGITVADQTQKVGTHEDFFIESYGQVQTFYDSFTAEETTTYNIGVHCYSEMQANDFYVRSVVVTEMADADMSLNGFTGSMEIVQNAEVEYTVTVANNGLKPQSVYAIKVWDITNPDNKVELATVTDVPEIPAGSIKVFPVKFTPTTAGAATLQAELVLDGDFTPDDNLSDPVAVNVLPEGTVMWNRVIYNESTYMDTTTDPIFVGANGNDSQLLYFADEMACSKDADIYKLAFEYTGKYDLDTPLAAKMYLSNTAKTEFADKFDEITEEKTLVYEGELWFKEGNNMLIFEFDEPFRYDHTKTLYVHVITDCDVVYTDYPVHFFAFDENYDQPYYYIRNNTKNGLFAFGHRIKLHLALKEIGNDGVASVNGELPITYNSVSRNVMFNGVDVASVEVYDIAGRLCQAAAVNGSADRLHLTVAEGIYIAKVTAADGVVATLKVNVK